MPKQCESSQRIGETSQKSDGRADGAVGGIRIELLRHIEEGIRKKEVGLIYLGASLSIIITYEDLL